MPLRERWKQLEAVARRDDEEQLPILVPHTHTQLAARKKPEIALSDKIAPLPADQPRFVQHG